MTSILRLVAALACGALFGFGLAVSGMLDPTRVRGFLDVFGRWDPSLAFVLAGAVGSSALGTVLASFLRTPLLGGAFERPSRTAIDGRLIGGAALFGIGWGLSGLCPGPALASLAMGIRPIVVFTVAMFVGMMVERFVAERSPAPRQSRAAIATDA